MADVSVSLSPDEFANTQTALEEYLTQLQLASEPEDDQPEVIASVTSALTKLDRAGQRFFSRGRSDA